MELRRSIALAMPPTQRAHFKTELTAAAGHQLHPGGAVASPPLVPVPPVEDVVPLQDGVPAHELPLQHKVCVFVCVCVCLCVCVCKCLFIRVFYFLAPPYI